MSVPGTLPPKTAKPLKRKRAEKFSQAGDDDDVATTPAGFLAAPVAAPAADGKHPVAPADYDHDDDDFSDSEYKSIYEDALDEIELNPYHPEDEDEDALSESEAAAFRVELRQIGPEAFIKKHLSSNRIEHRILGTAFGIDPLLIDDDDMYFRVLGLAIVRAFYKRLKLPQYNTIDDAAKLLKQSRSIMVITGAGISTSLGIPDFRSKGTGFYDKLQQAGYSEPEEVFDIHNFDENPNIFYSLAGDILPDQKRFTPTHAFIKLLQDRGRLQTNYTQNIDNLEELAGVDRSRLIQCHGSFATATCRKCKYKVPGDHIFGDIRAKRVARCPRCLENIARQLGPIKKRKANKPKKKDWEDSDSSSSYDMPEAGVMKPDITFFGEQLPDNFFDRFTEDDAKNVDLVLVIGTSLKVAPVSEMPNHLPHKVPHIYISREPVEHINFDIQLLGDCDNVVFELCRRAGWNLRHEMIPEGFRVKVKPVENCGYMWRVTPKKKKGRPNAVVVASSSAPPHPPTPLP